MWYGEGVKEKLRLKCGHLGILYSGFNEKNMMNSKIIVFFKLDPKPLKFCNGTSNQP
jgi:hypothetical protein